MDVYRPKEHAAGGSFPVIIMVHGGGLFVGNRKISRRFCEMLVEQGFLVFVPEYGLFTETDAFGEISDICAGLENIAGKIIEYGGDTARISLVAESAGAYLSVYAVAMQQSEKMRGLIGGSTADMCIKAIVFISGMFYTTNIDLIGAVYPGTLYGTKRWDRAFIKTMDPEKPETLSALLPAMFITSKADFLRDYTLRYADAFSKAGKDFN